MVVLVNVTPADKGPMYRAQEAMYEARYNVRIRQMLRELGAPITNKNIWLVAQFALEILDERGNA